MLLVVPQHSSINISIKKERKKTPFVRATCWTLLHFARQTVFHYNFCKANPFWVYGWGCGGATGLMVIHVTCRHSGNSHDIDQYIFWLLSEEQLTECDPWIICVFVESYRLMAEHIRCIRSIDIHVVEYMRAWGNSLPPRWRAGWASTIHILPSHRQTNMVWSNYPFVMYFRLSLVSLAHYIDISRVLDSGHILTMR